MRWRTRSLAVSLTSLVPEIKSRMNPSRTTPLAGVACSVALSAVASPLALVLLLLCLDRFVPDTALVLVVGFLLAAGPCWLRVLNVGIDSPEPWMAPTALTDRGMTATWTDRTLCSRLRTTKTTECVAESAESCGLTICYVLRDTQRKEEVTRVKPFGETLRAMRMAQEMGLRTAAERLRISPAYLSRVERGKERPPRPDLVKRMATLLGGDPDMLFRLAESTDPDLAEYIHQTPTVP